MKYISFILAIFIFGLAIQPCSDGIDYQDNHIAENHEHKNHDEGAEDSCSPFCVCACCGISIDIKRNVVYDFITVQQKITTKLNYSYQSIYRFDTSYIVWHPPKLIG